MTKSGGDTVVYGRAADIHEALKHVVDFVTLLWRNHPFREGNT